MLLSTGVCPGDNISAAVVFSAESSSEKNLCLGDGIRVESYSDKRVNLYATKPGTLSNKGSTFFIEHNIKIYEPEYGDQVVGIVDDRGGDFYRVNIFGNSLALLNRLSFEGATKRNKPELKRGDIVFALVKSCDRHSDTELTCVAANGTRKDWSSGDTVYGELSEGVLFRVSLAFAQALSIPNNVVLNTIGKFLSFEIAIGMNGAIWLKAKDFNAIVTLKNAILKSESLSDDEAKTYIENDIKSKIKS